MSHKFLFTPEAIEDLHNMDDTSFCRKWGIAARRIPIEKRRELGIQPFNLIGGETPHIVKDGVEYKWCQQGHWERVSNFGVHLSRKDGLRGWCKDCSNQKHRNDVRRLKETPHGRHLTRVNNHKRKNVYVKWGFEDEIRALDAFGGCCAYCGNPIDFLKVEFDHFVPIRLGGTTQPSNMVPSCTLCNRGSGGKLSKAPNVWLRAKFGEEQGEQIYNRCVAILAGI